jgi:MFS family permease
MALSRSWPSTRVRFLVLAWLCLAALIAYVCRNSLAVAEKTIRQDLGLTNLSLFGTVFTPEDQMGWVMSAFFLTYAFLQVPTGWLGQQWGTRRALPFFSVLWSAFTAAIAVAPGWIALLGARLGMGAAQAGLFPCTTNTTSKWFPATGRAFPSGALGAFMSIGGAAGTLLTGELLERLGPTSWRTIFLAYSVPGLVWALGFYWWFRDHPRDHASVDEAELHLITGARVVDRVETAPTPTPWVALLATPALWWICAQQFFRAAGYIFFASWFPTYLQETRGVSTATSGQQTMLPLLAVVAGSLVGGALSDQILRITGSRRLSRQGLAVVSLLLCTGLTVLAYPIDHVWLAVLIISAGSFCSSLAAPCAYTITIDMGGKHVTPVFSLMNMSGNIGAMVFPIVVPRLVYLTGSWELVLLVFAGVFAAAAACWLLINPDGTIPERRFISPAEKMNHETS